MSNYWWVLNCRALFKSLTKISHWIRNVKLPCIISLINRCAAIGNMTLQRVVTFKNLKILPNVYAGMKHQSPTSTTPFKLVTIDEKDKRFGSRTPPLLSVAVMHLEFIILSTKSAGKWHNNTPSDQNHILTHWNFIVRMHRKWPIFIC